MIRSHDRSGWFGASDTHTIMCNWETKTFTQWWMVKLGMIERNFSTPAMRAGTAYEHRILDALGIKHRDRQIRFWPLRLRVNLDGEDRTTIYEIKTYGGDCFRVTPAYWEQCQVEMLAARKKCSICAYRILPEDYDNYFNPIDPERIGFHIVEYNHDWVLEEYLPRLIYLSHCLKRRETPTWQKFLHFREKSLWMRLLGYRIRQRALRRARNTT